MYNTMSRICPVRSKRRTPVKSKLGLELKPFTTKKRIQNSVNIMLQDSVIIIHVIHFSDARKIYIWFSSCYKPPLYLSSNYTLNYLYCSLLYCCIAVRIRFYKTLNYLYCNVLYCYCTVLLMYCTVLFWFICWVKCKFQLK